ncbi:MAG: amino acid transporter [Microbacteriaceae bacterium]|nr:MAG: amino acid transporter [Microbacteriaceae bacterium]
MESLPTLIAISAAGLGLGLSLIVAIGAQNAYVLRQGIRREHIAVIVAICALSDLVLILLGISGIGFVIKQFPAALTVIRFAGVAFLFGYGLLAGRRAFMRQVLQTDASAPRPSLRTAMLTVLALTWLNPHVYLDTVLLLGSVANTHGDPGRWAFGLGAAIASVVWFALLGFGARFLGPLFARPIAWRVLDAAIAVTMIALGIRLLLGA